MCFRNINLIPVSYPEERSGLIAHLRKLKFAVRGGFYKPLEGARGYCVNDGNLPLLIAGVFTKRRPLGRGRRRLPRRSGFA